MNTYIIYDLLIFTISFSLINGAALETSVILPEEYVREFNIENSIEHPIFYLDYKSNNLFVGGSGRIFKLNLTDITSNNIHHDFVDTDIKIIQPFGKNKLFICGTSSSSSDDSTNWIIHKNFKIKLNESFTWKSPFSRKCYGITREATALMDTNGSTLYSGVFRSNKSDFHSASIFRTNLKTKMNNSVADSIDIQTSQNYKRIWPYGDENYVGSFDVDDQILFFFQETGTHEELQKVLIIDGIDAKKKRDETDIVPNQNTYFRVARVCKNDNGSLDSPRIWTTYAKARLDCKSFERIESIYKVPENDTFFYGIFTYEHVYDNLSRSFDSGIFIFHIDDINKAFDGNFMKIEYKINVSSNPVEIPQARPKLCQQDLSDYHNTTGDYSIMDTVIEPLTGQPIFELKEEQSKFTTIVVDKITKKVCDVDVEFTIIYVGTSKGEIYKIVQWIKNGVSQSELQDKFQVMPENEEIKAMEILSKHNSIYVASAHRVEQINLKMCERLKNSRFIDPYCESDNDKENCSTEETSTVPVESSTSTVQVTTNISVEDNESSTVHVESSSSNADVTHETNNNYTLVNDFNSVGCCLHGIVKKLICQTCELVQFIKNYPVSAEVIESTCD